MPGEFHIDPEVDTCLVRLCDALCLWEQHTGRGTHLVLIPHSPGEDVVVAVDGKPLPRNSITTLEAVTTVEGIRAHRSL